MSVMEWQGLVRDIAPAIAVAPVVSVEAASGSKRRSRASATTTALLSQLLASNDNDTGSALPEGTQLFATIPVTPDLRLARTTCQQIVKHAAVLGGYCLSGIGRGESDKERAEIVHTVMVCYGARYPLSLTPAPPDLIC
jgi:hypothetical protein